MLEPETRSGAVDWLKAIAIVAVVLTHSGPLFFDPRFTETDRLLRVAPVAFQVPVFLLVAGWVGASANAVPIRAIAWRVVRVLVPYTIASVLMTAIHYAAWENFGWNLLTGNALGNYYFVPVWAVCVTSGWLWSRVSERTLLVVLAAVMLASFARFAVPPVLSYFWGTRDLLAQGWLAYFLVGWCARIFGWERIPAAHRPWTLLAIAACLPWLWWEGFPAPTLPHAAAIGPARFAFSIGIAWIVCAWLSGRAPRSVAYLSSATLPVFLYHLPVAFAVYTWVAAWSPMARITVTLVLTLVLTLGGISIARAVLPKRAQALLLGA